MEHLLLKAATTATTDQGTFEAVISSATIDREKDIVSPAGMVAALKRWVPTGKNIPLAWNHSSEPDKQIGYIDPNTARAVGNEVWAKGWIDQSTDTGQHAWRQVKAGTLGFSFGYLTLKAKARRGGGREITELDVFEITATPTPMNNDTRVVAWKSLPDREEQRKRAEQTEREEQQNRLPDVPPESKQAVTDAEGETEDEDDPAEVLGQMISLAQDFIDDEPDAEDVRVMRQIMALLLQLQGTEANEGSDDQPEKGLQRRRADALALQFAAGDADTSHVAERQALRAELDEHKAQLATVQAELEEAREQLASRATDAKTLRRAADSLALDHVSRSDKPSRQDQAKGNGVFQDWSEVFALLDRDDVVAALAGEVKAVWTVSYINDLPDDSFLYIEPGGTKDSDGKTVPRSNRHFPYKDANGNIDLPHLRNALARIPQAQFISQTVKDRLTAKAQSILDNQKSLDATAKEPPQVRAVDPLRRLADAVALDFASDGESHRKPPRVKTVSRPQPAVPLPELKRRMREEILTALSGTPPEQD